MFLITFNAKSHLFVFGSIPMFGQPCLVQVHMEKRVNHIAYQCKPTTSVLAFVTRFWQDAEGSTESYMSTKTAVCISDWMLCERCEYFMLKTRREIIERREKLSSLQMDIPLMIQSGAMNEWILKDHSRFEETVNLKTWKFSSLALWAVKIQLCLIIMLN